MPGPATASRLGKADVGSDRGEGANDERDVRVEIDAELGGAAVDVLAVDGARERLVLELLPHRRRLEPATARAGLRRLSLLVNSVRIDQACARGITSAAVAGSATCRSTSSRIPSAPRAGATGCGAPSPGARGSSRPSRGRSTLPSGSGRPSGSPALLLRGLAQRLELGLQRADPLDELLDRLAHGVREVRLVQVDLPGHALTVAICYPAGNAHHNGVRRHLADDHRTGADAAAVADLEPADDLCAGADDDVVPERRVALLALEARPRQAHALVDRAVLPHLRGLADHA